ncbi:MAG: PilZ domain-containing protein [Candidatus Cloacimonetes bacterium]|nr:PilZ domain-containing protein [Candidatus Cloacimonadota bacterium]
MTFLQQISWHFRDSMEGSAIMMVTVILLLLLSPAFIKMAKDRLALQRRNSTFMDQLAHTELSMAERKMVVRAIHEISPGNPDALLQDPRIFNRWVDGMPEIAQPSAALIEQLSHIRRVLYSDVYVVPPLRSTRDFQPNLFVNICLARGANVLQPSVLVELDDGQLTFRLTRKDSSYSYRPGDRLLLHVPHPEAMYIAPVSVISVSSDQRQITVSHAQAREFQVRQYREFWRVDLDMSIRFHVITRDGDPDPAHPGHHDGHILNLSGGGAALVCARELPRGVHLRFPLYLADRVLNPVVARVIESQNLPGEKCKAHLMFAGISPEERDQIIRSLFQWQRERLQQDLDLKHGNDLT